MTINIILILILGSIMYAGISIAPWIPTNSKDLERINKISDLRPGELFLEIGCGNARVCSYIAEKNPEAKVIGIELAFFFYIISKIRKLFFGPKNLEIIFGNALKYNIANIDVLYAFATPATLNSKMKKKIKKEMKKEAKFISYRFLMNEWGGKFIQHKEKENIASINVYKKI